MIDFDTLIQVMILLLVFSIGLSIGILLMYAPQCHYCGKLIFTRKTRIRIAVEYGYYFFLYHRKCYLKYSQVEKNQIAS